MPGYQFVFGWADRDALQWLIGDYDLVEEDWGVFDIPKHLVAHHATGWPCDERVVGYKMLAHKALASTWRKEG